MGHSRSSRRPVHSILKRQDGDVMSASASITKEGHDIQTVWIITGSRRPQGSTTVHHLNSKPRFLSIQVRKLLQPQAK